MARNKEKKFHKYLSNLSTWKTPNHKLDQNRKKKRRLSNLFIINLFRCVAHEKLMAKKKKKDRTQE